VVEALNSGVDDTEQFVHRVVEKAADAGAAQTRGFGRQVERLADQAGPGA